MFIRSSVIHLGFFILFARKKTIIMFKIYLPLIGDDYEIKNSHVFSHLYGID